MLERRHGRPRDSREATRGETDAHPPFHRRIPLGNPFEPAGWTLALVAAAIVLASIAAAGSAQAGYPAVAARMAVDAASLLVQWIGAGVLAALAGMCVWLTIGYARGPRGRGTGIPGWAVAETYAVARWRRWRGCSGSWPDAAPANR